MKLFKKLKKGFTLIELVVVIAVIAILAAISVVSYIGVTNKAKAAADSEIITQLNTQMRAKSIMEGPNKTAYEAYLDAKEIGFNLELMKPSSKGEFVWDQENDLFACVEVNEENKTLGKVIAEDKTTKFKNSAEKSWVFTSEIDSEAEYCQYLNSKDKNENLIQAVNPVVVKSGFDAGENYTVTELKYDRSKETFEKEVTIRTNGGVLKINAPLDTVTRYGFATETYCYDVKVGTYNEAGKVGRLIYSDDNGKISFKNTSTVYCYMNISDDSSADATNTTKEDGAIVYTNVNADDQTTAHGYVEEKSSVTVNDGIVAVNSCPNHNTDYDIVKIGDNEYVLCKCCGGFTIFDKEGNKVTLENNDPNKNSEISSESASNFNYVPENHVHSGGVATCTSKPICENCGQEYGESLGHDFSGEYKDNGDGTHSQKCIRCDEYGVPSVHVGEEHSDSRTIECICGYVLHTHTIESYWYADSFTHWHPYTCEHNNIKANETAHTLDNKGKCTVCGWDSKAVVLVNNVGYDSLEAGLTAANRLNNSTVVLLKDCKYAKDGSGLWNLTKSMTFDGNGHTISGYGSRSGNKTTLAINNGGSSKVNVTLKNITIINSGAAGRPIETRGNIGTINFDNVTINATGGGNTQCLTIGGNQTTFAVVNIFNKSTFNAGSGGYPYISFNPANVTIKDSNLNGFCAMYFKGIDGSAGSKGSVVTATNCTFDSPNVHSSGSNDFGVFVMEDKRGEINITLDSCKINADIQNTANQAVFQKYLNGGTFTIKGNSFVNGIISEINDGTNASIILDGGEYILSLDKDPTKFRTYNDGFKLNSNAICEIKTKGGTYNAEVPSNYVADGYEAVDNGDGTWTIVKK